jgi:hypothetical protein
MTTPTVPPPALPPTEISMGDAQGGVRPPSVVPFDIVEAREKTRGRVAGWLVSILACVILAAFVTIVFTLLCTDCDKEYTDRVADLVMKLMTLIFTPLVALVGSAIGFYFGADPAYKSGKLM